MQDTVGANILSAVAGKILSGILGCQKPYRISQIKMGGPEPIEGYVDFNRLVLHIR